MTEEVKLKTYYTSNRRKIRDCEVQKLLEEGDSSKNFYQFY
jgi:hypothetical protein